MLFTSSILRLDTLLCANAIALPPDVRDALDLSLQHQLAKGDLASLKTAVHHLKAIAASTGATVKQSLAFEAIAAYLGARDWNTLRAHVEKSGLTLAARGTEVFTLFTREGCQFARFAFELISKGVGFAGLTELFGKHPTLKLRLFSRYSPAIHPALDAWQTQVASPLSPLIHEVMSNRADFFQTRASLEASFRDRSARSAKHYIIAEVVAPTESEGATPLERTLTDIRSKVLADLERALTAKLKIESTDALAGFEAIEPLAKASLEPWAFRSQSFTSEAAARIRFDTLIDLEALAPETEDWPSERVTGRTLPKMGYRILRHGIVGARVEEEPSTILSRLKKAILPEAPSRPTHPQYVLAASPWNAPIAASGRNGMLLQQREHGLAQIVPWGESEAENFLILSPSGGGKTFLGKEVVLQAIAHGKRVRVIDFNHEHFQYFQDVLQSEIFYPKEDSPQSLNPFSDIQSEKELRKMLPALASLLLELLELKDTAAIPLLENAIENSWKEHKETLELLHIKNTLEKTDNPLAKGVSALIASLLELAGPWLSGPGYTLASPTLLVELGEMNGNQVNPALRAVVERSILGLLHLEAITHPKPAVHFYEEAWWFTPSQRYLEQVVRECNESHTSIGLTNQTFRDIFQGTLGKALFTPDINILQLALRYEDSEVYERLLGLSQPELEILRYLRPAPGYTQFAFIRKGRIAGHFEFSLDAFTRLIYTTHHHHLNLIMQKVAEGNTFVEAVRILADLERQKEGL
jgi:hypothetical protein